VSAVERQLMIIGEAAKQIDPSFRHQFPETIFDSALTRCAISSCIIMISSTPAGSGKRPKRMFLT
jgi:hypothetical protein